MPKNFRYSTTGAWFKGNTHIHSTCSDGMLNFEQLSERYAAAGYHFLFRTDHWVCSQAREDPIEYPLLWLDGIELDGKDETGAYMHVVGLGPLSGITRETPMPEALQSVRRQGGLLVLAHPHWTGNTFDDALRHGFDGVEVYNNVCQWMNGKGNGGPYWTAMLERNPNTLSFASDDAHISPNDPVWNGGWIAVNAAQCSAEAVLQAIRTGNYYSTTGPTIEKIEYAAGKIYIKSSPVKIMRLVGPTYHCRHEFNRRGGLLSEAEFEIPEIWETVYLSLEDETRRTAWTNTLFTE